MTELKEKLPGVRESVPLAKFTTFKVGGPAKYFFIAKTSDDIVNAVSVAVELNIPYFILGGGSNLVISDQGFNGLVIKVEAHNYEIIENRIICDAGITNMAIVNASVGAVLTGFEWCAGIPGSIGGSVRGNAGAYGSEIKDSIKSVKVLNANGEVLDYTNEKCKFAYRDSIFKQNPNLLILQVEFEFEKGDRVESKKRVDEIVVIRNAKYPSMPSSGCTFKNVKFKDVSELSERLANEIPEKFKEWGIIPSAWIIENLGLGGFSIGGAEVSKDHCNFIVNTGNAKAEDIITLISLIKQKARDNFGVQLIEEVQLVGF